MKKLRVLVALLALLVSTFCVHSQNAYRQELKLNYANQPNKKSYLLHLLKSEKKPMHRSVISNEIGLFYQRESNLDSAAYFHRKALSEARKWNSDNEEIGISLNKIGVVFYYRGQLDSAAANISRSIPCFQQKKLKANSLNNLALMNKYNANPDIAIQNYIKAANLFEELKDTLNLIYVFNNIGALYVELDTYKKGLYYLNKATKLAGNEASFIAAKHSCYSNIASIYSQTGKSAEAIDMYNQNIRFYEETLDYSNLVTNKNNLADCHYNLGEKQVALKIYLEVLNLMEETGLENNKEAILINIASSQEEMGQLSSALTNYHLALSIIQTNEIGIRLENAYEGLASIHKTLGNSDSSLHYKDLQIYVRDSLEQLEKEKKMMELEADYGFNQLNKNLDEKGRELEKETSKNLLLSKGFQYSIWIIVAIAFLLLFFLFRYRRKKKLADSLLEENSVISQDIEQLESSVQSKEAMIARLSENEKLAYPKELTALTERERDVLFGLEEGLKDQEIAEKLFISITTVRSHLRKAYVKIDVRNRVEAMHFISTYEI